MNRWMRNLYAPPARSRKGQNGKLIVIGGGRKYHGAPVFSLLAARRFVDLLYFCPGENEPCLIANAKKIPEVIVVRDLKKMRDADCVLFGIGLGNASRAVPKPKNRNTKLVIDGDGLKRVKGRIPPGAILTPHEGEFRMLFGVPGTKGNVKRMAAKHGCVILKKGPEGDIITDGARTIVNKTHNAGMTKGGTGDVLSGLVAALACRNGALAAAAAGAYVNGYAGNMLRRKYGYNFCASDLADALAPAMKRLRGR